MGFLKITDILSNIFQLIADNEMQLYRDIMANTNKLPELYPNHGQLSQSIVLQFQSCRSYKILLPLIAELRNEYLLASSLLNSAEV